TEKKELSVYALLADRNGLKLNKAPARNCDAIPSPCRWLALGAASGLVGESVTLQSLAEQLVGFAQRLVVDKTGIEGRFDIHLPPLSRGAATLGSTADGLPVDPNLPSLSTVLQDVGLRLESKRELVDVYVIDHAEKPSEN